MKPDLHDLNRRFEQAELDEIVAWAAEHFPPGQWVLATSFGAEDVVLIDAIARLDLRPRVVTLDTGRLHQETYDLIDRVRRRYDLAIEVFVPDAIPLQRLLTEQGPNGFYDGVAQRKDCCRIRKMEPLDRALRGASAWMTGQRRAQSVTRTDLAVLEPDPSRPDVVKISPLARWTHDDVWAAIRTRNIPYSPLHDRGFPSIGCQPCTRAILPDEDLRAGRWWWEDPSLRECGLHRRPAAHGPDASPKHADTVLDHASAETLP